MLNSIAAAAGRLLISEPFMMDPNFKRSVILLTEVAETGAMGFILNHQSEYLLGDVLPDISYSEIPVYVGGPVAANYPESPKRILTGRCFTRYFILGNSRLCRRTGRRQYAPFYPLRAR